MIKKAAIARKMINFYTGNIYDTEHFLKVHSYAALIGRLENLDETTQNTLEIAAIVHDIACPLCREKYGNTLGKWQEAESEALLRPFLAEFALPEALLERVIELVCHHHTTAQILGIDHRILLEADFLVNAMDQNLNPAQIRTFRENVFATASGISLLNTLYRL